MIDLTDPQLAHLVARYRAWVEEENRKAGDYRHKQNTSNDEEYDVASKAYAELPWWKRLVSLRPVHKGHIFIVEVNWKTVTAQGFLDWCIREGIEVPEEAA